MIIIDVYIGYAHSEKFDYDVRGNINGYVPEPAMPRTRRDENKDLPGEGFVFWDIWKHPNSKIVDWGCSVLKMNLDEIIRLLRMTYWADKRPAEQIEKSMQNSSCYGVRLDDDKKLVGFARVISDYATTYYLCDVIIDTGKGGQNPDKF